MGGEVIAAATERSDVRVVGAVNRSSVEEVDGVEVSQPAAFSTLLSTAADHENTVVVDFTAPSATVDYASEAADHGVAFVTGTTGFDEDDETALQEASEAVPLLRASNFSRGIAALRRVVTAAVRAVPGYDVEVTETHHDGKRDAPSGTAETIVEDIEAERSDLETRQHGRSGFAPRESTEVGVHARRAGDISGEHEVLLAGDDNVLSLTHRAGSRRVFAAGALDAAVWLAGRDAGLYAFDDVLDTAAGVEEDAVSENTTTADDGGDRQ